MADLERAVHRPIIAVIVVAGVALGVLAYRNREQSKGQDLLAEAMVVLNTAVVPVTANTRARRTAPAASVESRDGTFSTETQKMNAALPKLRAAADAYPDTVAGITARYHLASSLASLGQQKDAIAQFDEVAKRAGSDSLYGRMAQLGKADAQVQSGEVDAAITTWKELAAKKDAGLRRRTILMELGARLPCGRATPPRRRRRSARSSTTTRLAYARGRRPQGTRFAQRLTTKSTKFFVVSS